MNTIMNPFEKYKKEYWQADKKRKGEILNIIAELIGMHKKSIIRRFRRVQLSDTVAKQVIPVKQGRPVIYGTEITLALKQLWELSGKVCGELLFPMKEEYIEQLKKNKQWKVGKEIEDKLLRMSLSTMKRKVSLFYQKDKESFRKELSTTRPSSLKSIIPIKNISWLKAKVGEGQIDTVVHCGNSLNGDMAYTLNYTDYQTYWLGLRAQMNKGQRVTVKSLLYIRKHQLPFDMLSVHPDTGSEFINWHLKEICDSLNIEMTRSRPNHKNDNMCVEERNGHIVRKKIGYIRIDCQEAVDVLNEYYNKLCLFLNHFVAIRRTEKKVRIGSRYRRKYEEAKTPYQRVMESDEISDKVKKNLKKIHNSLNMVELQKELVYLEKKIQDTQKEFGGRLY